MVSTEIESDKKVEKHEVSNKKIIWKVFGILTVITSVEVFLGIEKPAILHLHTFFNVSILIWIYITLTIVKAYYIVWFFMHMVGERKSFRIAVVFTLFYLIIALMGVLMTEGGYIHSVLSSYVNWGY